MFMCDHAFVCCIYLCTCVRVPECVCMLLLCVQAPAGIELTMPRSTAHKSIIVHLPIELVGQFLFVPFVVLVSYLMGTPLAMFLETLVWKHVQMYPAKLGLRSNFLAYEFALTNTSHHPSLPHLRAALFLFAIKKDRICFKRKKWAYCCVVISPSLHQSFKSRLLNFTSSPWLPSFKQKFISEARQSSRLGGGLGKAGWPYVSFGRRWAHLEALRP